MESETKDSQVIIQYLCDPNNGASYDTKISLKYDDFGTNISGNFNKCFLISQCIPTLFAQNLTSLGIQAIGFGEFQNFQPI